MTTEMITTILSIVFGGTSVVAVVKYLIERKANRQLKSIEVKKSDTDVQKEQIDLGHTFMQQSLEAVRMIQESTGSISEQIKTLTETMAKNQQDVEVIVKKITYMSRTMATQGKRLGFIEKYLDGPFKDFMSKQKKGDSNNEENNS